MKAVFATDFFIYEERLVNFEVLEMFAIFRRLTFHKIIKTIALI